MDILVDHKIGRGWVWGGMSAPCPGEPPEPNIPPGRQGRALQAQSSVGAGQPPAQALTSSSAGSFSSCFVLGNTSSPNGLMFVLHRILIFILRVSSGG